MRALVARTLVLAALLAWAGTACSGGGRVHVDHDPGLQRNVLELSRTGTPGRLADLTTFSWDTVYIFGEGAPAADIEAAVGEPVITGRFYDEAGNLLVFASSGRVVAAKSVVPDVLATGGKTRWGATVRLEPVNDHRPAVLRLVER
jgi:hypothetical protein